MMKFEHEGREYHMRFSHPAFHIYELRMKGKKFHSNVPSDGTRRCTECSITDVSGNMLGYGVAICNSMDNFRKTEGRKRALTHLLSLGSSDCDVRQDRSFRKAAWDAYLKNHKQ